ncbi:MAG: Na+/H+ antiporter subunit E [Rhodomicrobium sp.]|nr:MAG: Na+/H+ antiporter subunit E [Rhodomicrobium sp.]
MSNLFLINVLMAVAWCAVLGSFTLMNLLFGFAVSSGALWLTREQYRTSKYFHRFWLVLGLVLLFLKELVLSVVRVAWLVIRPSRSLNPSFVSFPLTVTKAHEITLLANLITLTPGTLSVDVSDDNKTLYIHCIDVDDVDALRRDIAEGFERKIMEALR